MDLEINSNVAVAVYQSLISVFLPLLCPKLSDCGSWAEIAPCACCNNSSGIYSEQGLGGSELVLSEGSVGHSCCLLGSVQPLPRAALQTWGNKWDFFKGPDIVDVIFHHQLNCLFMQVSLQHVPHTSPSSILSVHADTINHIFTPFT